jgi:hypothetical protein
MSDRQSLNAGEGSLNVQAAGSVYVGMQYADIRQLFMDLFNQNYETLLADASQEAERRAAEVVDAFLRKLAELPPAFKENLREPGVQRALIQAEVEHATTGEQGEAEIYANLLIQKVQEPAKNLTSIACQQAIETVGQLTQAHIDVLSCLFVVLKVSFMGILTVEQLRAKLAQFLDPLAQSITGDHDVLRHLDATACLAFDTTRAFNIATTFRSTYPQILADIPESELFEFIAGDNHQVLSVFRAFAENDGALRSCFLSNKGVAIAHANIARSMPIGPLATWVH